jgi:uncharacterized protein (TIGR00255 family)
MTGFGRGEASDSGFQVTVEIRTLNSRYLDISVRLPQSIQHKELTLKESVQSSISRGKVNVSVNVDKAKKGSPDITFNPELVKNYGEILEQIKAEANIKQDIQLKDLFQFNNIFETKKEDEEEINTIYSCTYNALQTALDNLNLMRQKEGTELKEDLSHQIEGIAAMLSDITGLSQNRAPEIREKLHERIKKMVSDDSIDPDRMEMEVALLVDKMDINEEVVRLQSHLKFFLEALEAEEPVGRRLNFLCQEINRELNTIGSKANDSEIAHHVVLGKEKLEQIREQVQNIE